MHNKIDWSNAGGKSPLDWSKPVRTTDGETIRVLDIQYAIRRLRQDMVIGIIEAKNGEEQLAVFDQFGKRRSLLDYQPTGYKDAVNYMPEETKYFYIYDTANGDQGMDYLGTNGVSAVSFGIQCRYPIVAVLYVDGKLVSCSMAHIPLE